MGGRALGVALTLRHLTEKSLNVYLGFEKSGSSGKYSKRIMAARSRSSTTSDHVKIELSPEEEELEHHEESEELDLNEDDDLEDETYLSQPLVPLSEPYRSE